MPDHSDTPALTIMTLEHAARDALAIWQCGYGACADYMVALGESRGPQDVIAANAELMAANVNLFASAVGILLQRAGVDAPVLNDA